MRAQRHFHTQQQRALARRSGTCGPFSRVNMAFQFVLWLPRVAMVPKGVLVDRELEQAPPDLDEDEGLEEIVDDQLMPRKHELWSGSPSDLVPIRMLEMAKLVFASDPMFAQNSPDRLVHDLHVVESGPWPSLAIMRPAPLAEPVFVDSSASDAKSVPTLAHGASPLPTPTGTGVVAPEQPADDVDAIGVTVAGGTVAASGATKGAVIHEPSGKTKVGAVDGGADGAIIMFRTVPGEADHVLVQLGRLLGVGRDELPQCGTISIMNVELTKPRSAMQAPVELGDEDATSAAGEAGAGAGHGGSGEGSADGGSAAGAISTRQTSGRRGPSKPQIRARVLVDKILDQIATSAELSFDFVMMVIIAAILAAAGLATNNAVVIVASMLVSPLMSPVLALTFGMFVCDRRLAFTGAISELVGLVLCVLVGFISGLLFAFLAEFSDFTGGEWPTSEMSSRGTGLALIVGVVVALASGCGVALGTAGNNVSGLVGVAISASLLPPIVNAGIFWAYVVILPVLSGPVADSLRTKTEELIEMGGFSLSLALVNIGCILVSATGMFWIKEVAPIAGKSLLFSGTTAAVRRMYLGTSATPSDPATRDAGPSAPGSPGYGGAESGGPADTRNQQTIGAATAVLGGRRHTGHKAPAVPASKPIGMERAIQLVVSSGWHQDIDISRAGYAGTGAAKAGPTHRKHASAGLSSQAASLAGAASAAPGVKGSHVEPLARGASVPIPGQGVASLGAAVSAPSADGARSLPEGATSTAVGGGTDTGPGSGSGADSGTGSGLPRDSSMTVDHRSSGRGKPHQLTPSRPGETRGMRYPGRVREPHAHAGRVMGSGSVHDTVAIVGDMGGRLGVSTVRHRPRPRGGVHFAAGISEEEEEEDGDEANIFTVTRQLDLSDLGGRSMFGGSKPRSLGAQIDGALAQQAQEATSGLRRQGSRMDLSEIMMRFAAAPADPRRGVDPAAAAAEAAAQSARAADAEASNQHTLGAATSVLSQRRLKRQGAPRPALPWPARK